ncbi:MAG: hypothetical protein A2V88_03185 [Elusimicrobia bacterium RBG_16_66_12]|nr:MAG: hypothetical protein A2V88_03185 [Elusimicrobia bacterium RBG_16_66_12]
MSLRRILLATYVVGAAALAFGADAAPQKIGPSLLLVGFFPLSLSLGAGVFLAIDHVTGARWSAGLRPLAVAMTRCYWPFAAVLMAAVAFGWTEFYGWTHAAGAHGHVAHSQQVWLAPGFLLARAAAYLTVWGVLLRRIRGQASAAVFLVSFGVTLTLAGFDWFMALEPSWSSTMFGVYVFAGLFLSALAALAVGAILLGQDGESGPAGARFHDLGKLIFGFSMFWAYIWYCQYMLIWYTNIPEEITYFLRRHGGGWAVLSLTSIGLNWLVPFFVLLPQWTKTDRKVLLRVGLAVLAGHWLDLYIMTMPRFAGASPSFGVWEGLVFLGTLAAFGMLVLRQFDRPREMTGA